MFLEQIFFNFFFWKIWGLPGTELHKYSHPQRRFIVPRQLHPIPCYPLSILLYPAPNLGYGII
jgi:hypothetical protein